jgi:putative GTP pyrophosphokinase
MKQNKILSNEELKERLIRFYSRYGDEVEQIKNLIEIKLKQICLAYTLQNNLPQEALTVCARKKTLKSLIKKFEDRGWPQFYYPTEIVTDLIGARITCWFLDDIDGLLYYIKKSSHFKVVDNSIEDYITEPKP